MEKHQKSWTQAEKLVIVHFYKENGAGKASKEYNVSTGTIYRWIELFEENGSKIFTSKRNMFAEIGG
jgi:transposase-like protein